MTEQTQVEEQETEPEQRTEVLSWEFDHPPSYDEVFERLSSLRPVFGVRPVDYIDHVAALSQSKNIAEPGKSKAYKTFWRLYVTVAGRQAMVAEAAEKNDWTVDFRPESFTPTGIPGYLQFDENRIVYREYMDVTRRGQALGETRPLGSKPGTAWVPGSGGSGAVASNRFEKVETSARGRSIAAWGFGILPGSGVASLDEVEGARDLAQVQGSTRQQRTTAPQRSELVERARGVIAEFEQVSGLTAAQVDEKVESWVARTFAKEVRRGGDDRDGPWDFAPLKDGEISLLTRRIADETKKAKAEASQL